MGAHQGQARGPGLRVVAGWTIDRLPRTRGEDGRRREKGQGQRRRARRRQGRPAGAPLDGGCRPRRRGGQAPDWRAVEIRRACVDARGRSADCCRYRSSGVGSAHRADLRRVDRDAGDDPAACPGRPVLGHPRVARRCVAGVRRIARGRSLAARLVRRVARGPASAQRQRYIDRPPGAGLSVAQGRQPLRCRRGWLPRRDLDARRGRQGRAPSLARDDIQRRLTRFRRPRLVRRPADAPRVGDLRVGSRIRARLEDRHQRGVREGSAPHARVRALCELRWSQHRGRAAAAGRQAAGARRCAPSS